MSAAPSPMNKEKRRSIKFSSFSTSSAPRVSLATNPFGSTNEFGVITGRTKRTKLSDMGQQVLEGFILTAGLDQHIYLWTTSGDCVGEFGTFGWDINDSATWAHHLQALSQRTKALHAATATAISSVMGKNPNSKDDKASGNAAMTTSGKSGKKGKGKGMGGIVSISAHQHVVADQSNAVNTVSSTREDQFSANNITKDTLFSIEKSPSTQFLQSFIRHYQPLQQKQQQAPPPLTTQQPQENSRESATVASSFAAVNHTKTMNQYVEVLTKKIIAKSPVYHSIDSQFQQIMTKHPMNTIAVNMPGTGGKSLSSTAAIGKSYMNADANATTGTNPLNATGNFPIPDGTANVAMLPIPPKKQPHGHHHHHHRAQNHSNTTTTTQHSLMPHPPNQTSSTAPATGRPGTH
jgi:hypothetical protein